MNLSRLARLASLFLAASQLLPHPGSAAPRAGIDEQQRIDLVSSNHILVRHGVLDGWGHVSVRSTSDPSHFYIARSIAPANVTLGDIVEVDSGTCTVVGRPGVRTYLERFIHCSIYRARPDVRAVVHDHSPDLIPFADTGTQLLPLYHVTAFLGGGTGFFEISQVAGAASDMLVGTPIIGEALARSLGGRPLVLMRGHGATVVGASLQQAVYRAVYANEAARMQLAARALGVPTALSAAESQDRGRVGGPATWASLGPVDV